MDWQRATDKHWFCVVPLIPVTVMFVFHQATGMTFRLPAPTNGEIAYNYAMAAAFFLGIAGFILHALKLASRGMGWVELKLFCLLVAIVVLAFYGLAQAMKRG